MFRRSLVDRRWMRVPAYAQTSAAAAAALALVCAAVLPSAATTVPTFTRITGLVGLDDTYSAPGVYGPGVAVVDYDDDGDLDLFVPNDRLGHCLYRNDGYGNFTNVAPAMGLDFIAAKPAPEDDVHPTENDPTSMMPCFVDTDNDGDLDFFLTVWNGYSRYFENVGGEYVDRTHTSGLDVVGHTATAAWGDFDRDGLLDVYLADWGGFDRLFHNEGGHRFTDVSARMGLYDRVRTAQPGWSAIWFDHDGDGLLDLYVGNDYGIPNFLYLNTGNGFVESARQHFPELLDPNRTILQNNATMGQALGDFDRDGDYDMFVANSGPNDLYERRGDQYYDLMEDPTKVGPGGPLVNLKNNDIGWFCDWPDLDHDGWIDLFLVNGYIYGASCPEPNSPYCRVEQPNLLWMNNGNGTFQRVTDLAGLTELGWSKAGAFADFDDDGDLDLFVTNSGAPLEPSRHAFWRNDTPNLGNWLQVDLMGTDSNRDGYNAQLRARIGSVVLMRDHFHSTGYLSQASPYVHFGLGDANVVDELTVTWPSGRVDRLTNVRVNQRLRLVEGGTADGVATLPVPRLRLSSADAQVELEWALEGEAAYDRFLVMRTREGRTAGTVAIVDAESGVRQYRWIDRQVEDGATYQYTVIAEQGDTQVRSAVATVTVRAHALRLALRPASPNPFNPRTVLAYRTAEQAEQVTLRIVDARGRTVRSFVPATPGLWNEIVWDGTDETGRAVASGNYRFVVEADGQVMTTALTLIR